MYVVVLYNLSSIVTEKIVVILLKEGTIARGQHPCTFHANRFHSSVTPEVECVLNAHVLDKSIANNVTDTCPIAIQELTRCKTGCGTWQNMEYARIAATNTINVFVSLSYKIYTTHANNLIIESNLLRR